MPRLWKRSCESSCGAAVHQKKQSVRGLACSRAGKRETSTCYTTCPYVRLHVEYVYIYI